MNISRNIQEIKEKEYEKVCKKIKLFIGINPGLPKYEISRRMGIELDLLDELINEGMLEEIEGEVRVAGIMKRNDGEERRKRFREELNVDNYIGSYNGSFNPSNETSNRSKLVEDLERKYRNIYNDRML